MRRLILLTIVASLPFTALARPASAAASTPFTAIATWNAFVPGAHWETGYVDHVRGDLVWGDLTGDLQGTISVVHNYNSDLLSGNAEEWGTAAFVTSSVTWNASFWGNTNGIYSLVGQGTDGSKLTATWTEVFCCGYVLFQGSILDPNG